MEGWNKRTSKHGEIVRVCEHVKEVVVISDRCIGSLKWT